jgi:hypothetical protein
MMVVVVMGVVVIVLMVVAVAHVRAPCGSAATSCLAPPLSIVNPLGPRVSWAISGKVNICYNGLIAPACADTEYDDAVR